MYLNSLYLHVFSEPEAHVMRQIEEKRSKTGQDKIRHNRTEDKIKDKKRKEELTEETYSLINSLWKEP